MDFNDYQAGLNKDYFWFQGKRDLIKILLQKLVLPENCKILNVGAGTGEDVSVMNKFGSIYAIDINQDALNLIPNELVVDKKIMDVCNMNYSDNYFDVVLAFDVLEHLKNDQRAIQEIKRVLKKETGVFIFTVPAFNFMYSLHDEKLGHVRRYNKKMIKNLLSEYFNFMQLRYWFFLLFPFAFMQRMISKVFVKRTENNFSEGKMPAFIDKIFYKILKFENFFISKNRKFPFGLTLYGICKTRNKI